MYASYKIKLVWYIDLVKGMKWPFSKDEALGRWAIGFVILFIFI